MNSRRRVLAAIAAALLVGGLAALVWPRENEPSYEGKPLSAWLYAYERGTRSDASADELREHDKAATAVRAIGAKAVPFLLAWLDHQVPKWRIRLLSAYYKHLASQLYPDYRVYGAIIGAGAIRSELAMTGFEILGGQAREAVGELTRRINAGDKQAALALALGFIGPDGLPSLLAVLGDPRSTNRAAVAIGVSAVKDLGTNAHSTVSVLVQCLKDPDIPLARNAAMALGELGVEPDTAVPALAESLKSPDRHVRTWALFALGRFEGKASSGAPAVVTTLTDPDQSVRVSATNALSRIAPEVFRQYEVH